MKHYITSLLLVLCLSAQTYGQSKIYKAITLAEGAYEVYQAATLTDEDMQKYMGAVMKVMDSRNNVCSESSPYTKRLRRITAGLRKVRGVPLNFKVYVNNEVNAFASPDGSVRVYTKIMDIMNDDELLGIIGHELGHVAHRDSRKELQKTLLTAAARNGLALSDSRIGEIARSSVGAISVVLLSAKYSRDQEASADNYGYRFLRSRGKNPWAMATAFKKMKDMNDSSSSLSKYVTKFLSTHPAIDSRIKVMAERARKDGFKRPKAD